MGGSQPKEIYNEVLKEEIDLLSKKLKPAFKTFMRENTKISFVDRSFDCFNSTLMPVFTDYREKFSNYERILLHEYYESRLKQRERDREKEIAKVRDEVQYRLKKKIQNDLPEDNKHEFTIKVSDYHEVFDRYADEEGAKTMFTSE